MVRSMPVSLWVCFSRKSVRDCMSMNDLREGYWTMPMRSQPVDCSASTTSPANASTAPMSARSRYFMKLIISTGPSWSGGHVASCMA